MKTDWKVCPNVHHEALENVLRGLEQAGFNEVEFLPAGVSGTGPVVTVVAMRKVTE